MRSSIFISLVCLASLLAGCMDYGPLHEEELSLPRHGVMITNQGNFMYGNATITYYMPETGQVENEVFLRANAARLGDVAQSVSLHDGKGYIVVNNSGVIFEIDPDSFRVTGMITGLSSPRYMCFVGDGKAYVSDLNSSHLSIVDTRQKTVTGRIDMGPHPSTERMVRFGDEVLVNCWSYDDTILVVDCATDRLVDSLKVGTQPVDMTVDRNGKLWVLCDGGYQGSVYGYTAPSLSRIDLTTRRTELTLAMEKGHFVGSLELNPSRDTLYYIDGGVWRMSVEDNVLPEEPVIPDRGTRYFGMGIDPLSGDIYVADAIDYQQPGTAYRYSSSLELLDSFRTGIIPGEFCFR